MDLCSVNFMTDELIIHQVVIFKKVCSRNNSLIAVHKHMQKFTAELKCFFIAIMILLSGQFLGKLKLSTIFI